MNSVVAAPAKIAAALDFLWLELTNQCNLECVHCYAGSSPHEPRLGLLGLEDYRELIEDAAAHGCRSVQFIGGEPTLNPFLASLIQAASERNFDYIEVYTNLVALPQPLLDCFVKYQVRVATSIYSSDAATHDKITTRMGSWERSTRNLQRIMKAGLALRASVIEMDDNRSQTQATVEWLKSLGVGSVGTDHARGFGRAQQSKDCSMGDLCGQCSKGTLCVGPDGVVAPCIMSKAWPVGSLTETNLPDILCSERLGDTRKSIYEQTLALHETTMGGCTPDRPHPCSPDRGDCTPCNPKGHCGPNDCQPVRRR
jgi:sulfatase maturation enzyme AslB (radical SAM superfamily)